MLEYLPAEIQLKILKNISFDDISSIKQTNKYFCHFINKYKGNFARKRFEYLDFSFGNLKELKLKSNNDFPLNDHIMKKWLIAVDSQIPTYLKIGNE
ncbi:F-box domain-containing protein [Meloidogyne graminicola]|uniref:F-box domain-containing protein n=1 Tax=Meloidogyne graminicola TaxID=189291 RepID=A0A8S9Z5Z8_9BILA|nr:F-box domain-containing protein [Meloidogyne graminicola]